MVYGVRKSVVKRPATAKRATRTYKKKYTPRKVPTTVRRYVKAQIGKATEDKFQEGEQFDPSAIITLQASSVQPTYFVNTVDDVFGFVNQGTGQGERVGNEITLKKWIIRGALTQNPFYIENPLQQLGSSIVYVDVYIGYRNDLQIMSLSPLNELPNFYQSGNASSAPVGNFTELLDWVNKDVYTVLFHKRFKMGNNSNNNDFSLARTFSFNICSKLFKNAKLKYNDNTGTVQNAKLNALALWCTAINGNGTNMFQTSTAVQRQSSYACSFSNNIMYTDA